MGSYYRNRTKITASRDYKKPFPELQDVSNLNLNDLKKIRDFIVSYPRKLHLVNHENNIIKSDNEKKRAINEERQRRWENEKRTSDEKYQRQFVSPIENKISSLKAELSKYAVSFLESLITSDVFTSNILGIEGRFYGAPARQMEKEIQSLMEQRWKLIAARPTPPQPKNLDLSPQQKEPNDYTVLTISGAKVRFYYHKLNLADVNRLISEAEIILLKDKEKISEIKARANRNESAVRNQAKNYTRGIAGQIEKFSGCPYCGGELNNSNSHQDHIHPVSKGGLSIAGNLVFVCISCNLKKRDKSLRVFVRDQGLDFDIISDRLDMLGKH